MKRNRTWFGFFSLVTAALIFGGPNVWAADFPSEQIRLIVPWKPGGSTDISARKLQPYLEQELGVTVVVENMPGGAGKKGMSRVYRAEPDGYTLIIEAEPTVIMGQVMNAEPTYDVSKLSLLYGWISMPRTVAVNSESKHKTFAELLDASQKAEITIGGVGLGTLSHMQSVLLREMGLEHRYVPFGSGGKAKAAGLGGHVDAIVAATLAVKSNVDAGTIRVLAIHATEPTPGFEGVPTLQDLGYEGMSMTMDIGIAGPPGMDEKTMLILEQAIERAVNNPKFLAEAKKDDTPLGLRNRKQWNDRVATLLSNVEASLPLLKAEMEAQQ